MVDIKSGPVELIRGIVEDVFGRAKQVIGIIIGHNDLIREGKAQQDKAEAQRNAGRKEAEAAKARAKAKVYGSRERTEKREMVGGSSGPGSWPGPLGFVIGSAATPLTAMIRSDPGAGRHSRSEPWPRPATAPAEAANAGMRRSAAPAARRRT
jgi:uncharacterized protein YjbJ (UPF0337 family)